VRGLDCHLCGVVYVGGCNNYGELL
jgi:hypothetical protein